MQHNLTPEQRSSLAWDEMLDSLYMLAAVVEEHSATMPLPVLTRLARVREEQQRYIASLADAS